MGSFSIRQPGKYVLEIGNRVYAEALTSFDQTQDRCSGSSALFRAGKEPVPSREDYWFNAALAPVIRDFHKGIVDVNLQSVPAIESVSNGFAKFCFRQYQPRLFKEPVSQKRQLWFGKSLPEIETVFRRETCGNAFNIKEAFDYAHRKFGGDGVLPPGILKVAMHMRPAVCRYGPVSDDLIELVGAVSLYDATVAGQSSFRVLRVLCLGKVVYDIWVICVTAIHPNEGSMGFSQASFDYRHCGGVRLNNSSRENSLRHFGNYGGDKLRNLSKPARHRCSIDGKTESLESLLLSVERLVKPEFVSRDFCQKSWTSKPFVDWLIWFLGDSNVSTAIIAGILVGNMLDVFKQHSYKLKLVGNIKADDGARLTAAGTGYLLCIKAVLLFSGENSGSWRSATTAFSLLRHDVKTSLLCIYFRGSGIVNDFASASKQSRIYLSRLSAKGCAIAATELFFEFRDASEKFFNQSVAVSKVIRQFWLLTRALFCGSFWHECSAKYDTI